jgi:hypothetical protein
MSERRSKRNRRESTPIPPPPPLLESIPQIPPAPILTFPDNRQDTDKILNFIKYLENIQKKLKKDQIDKLQYLINKYSFQSGHFDKKNYHIGFEIMLALWSKNNEPPYFNFNRYFNNIYRETPGTRERAGAEPNDLPVLLSDLHIGIKSFKRSLSKTGPLSMESLSINNNTLFNQFIKDNLPSAIYDNYCYIPITDILKWPYMYNVDYKDDWNTEIEKDVFLYLPEACKDNMCSDELFNENKGYYVTIENNCCVNNISPQFKKIKKWLDVFVEFFETDTWSNENSSSVLSNAITPLDKYGNTYCYICGKPVISKGQEGTTGDVKNIDHIIPILSAHIFGLNHFPLNFTPTHQKCNQHKGDKIPSTGNTFDLFSSLFPEEIPIEYKIASTITQNPEHINSLKVISLLANDPIIGDQLQIDPEFIEIMRKLGFNHTQPTEAITHGGKIFRTSQLKYNNRILSSNLKPKNYPSSINITAVPKNINLIISKKPVYKTYYKKHLNIINKTLDELNYIFKNSFEDLLKTKIKNKVATIKLFNLDEIYLITNLLKTQKQCLEYILQSSKSNNGSQIGGSIDEYITKYFIEINKEQGHRLPTADSLYIDSIGYWLFNDRKKYLISRYILYHSFSYKLFEAHKKNMGYDTNLPEWLVGKIDSNGDTVHEYEYVHFIIDRIVELSHNGILLEVNNDLT